MRDLNNIRHLHQTNQPARLEGYEPILEVEIPGEPTIRDAGNDLLVDFKRKTGSDGRITAIGDSRYRSEVKQQLLDDPMLQRLLINSHHQTDISVPSVDLATRSLINPATTLMTNHPLIKTLPEQYQPAGALLLEYILKYHEIGTREASGGHFTSIIDPETLVLGEQLPWSDMRNIIRGRGTHTRALPWRYHEVRAVLQERQILDSLVDEEQNIIDALRSGANRDTAELEEALKSVKLDRLGELLTEWDTYFDTHRNEAITTLADRLEAELTREQALDLLRVPQEAVMHPSKWLCHLIYDLRTGRDPEEIRWHGSYWETTKHGPEETFETVKEETSRRRDALIESADRRGSQSTYELVTITDDSLIRRWYSYEPTDEFQLRHVRYGIVIQQLFNQLHQQGIRIINDGKNPAAFVHKEGERPFNAAKYQLDGVDPFAAVINGQADETDIGYYFDYETDRPASYKAWEYGRQRTRETLGFSTISEMVDWIEHGSN